jgi:hypothetical protein
MLTETQLKDLIKAWKHEQRVSQISKRSRKRYEAISTNPVERRQAIVVLIDTLIDVYSYIEDDLKSMQVIKHIVAACVYEDFQDKKALNSWRKNVEEDIEFVLYERFPKGHLFVKKEFNPSEVKESKPIEIVGIPQPMKVYVNESSETESAEVRTEGTLDLEKLKKHQHPEYVPDIIDLDFLKLLKGESNE